MAKAVTLKQLKAMFDYLSDKERQGTFRYIVYEIMGFKHKDYCDLYYTGLMNFKDMIYELRDDNRALKRKNKELRKKLSLTKSKNVL
jgi:hypothetical protein